MRLVNFLAGFILTIADSKTDRRETLIAFANLGRQIAALLDPETPVPGVTSGKLRPEMKTIAVVSRVGTGNLDPNTGFVLTTN